MKPYDPKSIEGKWQKYWEEHPELSQALEGSIAPKFYCLDMFPYPSGSGLHVGHVENYTATDIYSRFLRMRGYNVLHPMGWDAFGLPAENYAIKMGIHPSATNATNIKTFIEQMNSIGLIYDWSREINTAMPDYYRWTQWLFLLLYKHDLAYKKSSKVNWCNSCETVLANEQAEGGICERCKTLVVQKDMEQWFFKTTDFLEDQVFEGREVKGLISGLDGIDWPESTKAEQRNWLGKSEGVQFQMPLNVDGAVIEVYTTRIDTVFGVTYVVVSPEHPIINSLKANISNWDEVEDYVQGAKIKTERERIESNEKTGVELKGVKVLNPLNQDWVPVFVADYVLAHYGTGAVMAVPAHDNRDFEFAQKYNLLIREVVQKIANEFRSGSERETSLEGKTFTRDGILVNSQGYSEMTSQEAREAISQWIESQKIGIRKINYKFRDWGISRQRYWGAPIPIIYCDACGEIPVPEKDLPVLLPTDVAFKPTGESPLIYSETFHDVTCPICGKKARRESDTMDTFVCSSWYFLRFADPSNTEEFASRELMDKWLPVDLYMGGAEHTVLHLIYARFFTKMLKKFGYIGFDEPFLKLRHQGTILGEDGQKMSKTIGNVINPDEVVEKFGADTLRLYEMSLGPLEETKAWNTNSIVGSKRFLERVWRLQGKVDDQMTSDKKTESLLHRTIKKVTEDIERLQYNTAISALTTVVNVMTKEGSMSRSMFETFVVLLSPFAPHIAEEIWQSLGHNESIGKQPWPEWNDDLCEGEEVAIVVQVDGKVRLTLNISVEVAGVQEEVERLCLEHPRMTTLKREMICNQFFVPHKLINFVTMKREK
jgi:leucyl-tRNA synthetase